jgi:hypothetical protein
MNGVGEFVRTPLGAERAFGTLAWLEVISNRYKRFPRMYKSSRCIFANSSVMEGHYASIQVQMLGAIEFPALKVELN